MSRFIAIITLLFVSSTVFAQTQSTNSVTDTLVLKAYELLAAGEKKTGELIEQGLAKMSGPAYISLTEPATQSIITVTDSSLGQIDKMATEKRDMTADKFASGNTENVLTYAEIKLYLVTNLKKEEGPKDDAKNKEISLSNRAIIRRLKAHWQTIALEIKSDKLMRAYSILATHELLNANTQSEFLAQKALVDAINESLAFYLKINANNAK
jgi:hypothetical protein